MFIDVTYIAYNILIFVIGGSKLDWRVVFLALYNV